jgi:putative ABC transport system permease protein
MSTTLGRPAEARAGDGGVPARRAVLRWAWRLFRREWRQQLLVLALIAAAVATTIVAAAVATNTPPPANTGFGSANHLVVLQGSDSNLTAGIAAIKAHFGTADVIENEQIATGLVGGAQLRAQDPHGPYGQSMLALVSGHYPSGAGEVGVTSQMASSFGLRVGDVWHEAGRSLRVVGIVENPQNLLDNFALVAPGQIGSRNPVTVLFDATPKSIAGFRFPQGAAAVTPQRSGGLSPAIIVLAVAVLGLIFIGLVVMASFTVLAQRRLRSLGMLSSLGATDRHIRLVMVANGAVVGIIGALAGAVVGLVAWIAYAPHLAVSAHHRVTWTNLPWWMIATALVLAIVTSILAAVRPARTVTRTPAVSALSGRPAPPQAVHRSALPGAGLLVLGLVLLAFSGGWGGTGAKDYVFLFAGIIATTAGLMFLSPLAIATLALVARRPPVAARIALRDLVRYRSRSGAALAATSFAVLIAVLIILLATGRFADPLDYSGPNLAANQLVVYAPGYGSGSGGGGAISNSVDAQRASQLQDRATPIAATLGSHDVLALEASNGVFLQGKTSHGNSANMYVATPALLRHYGIDPSAIEPTTILITSRRGLANIAGLQLLYGPPPTNAAPAGPRQFHTLANPKIQTFTSLPSGTSAPNLLLTAYAVQKLNLQAAPAAWLIRTAKPLTALQINAARQTAFSANMTVETKSDAPSLSQLRSYATLGGILLALAVLAVTVSLIRGETQGELRILTATGASSRIRRSITGATAGSIALLGAFLGTAVAYLATVAFFRSQLSQRMGHVPVLDLLLILVGLPVVATVGGWLFAGRQPPAIARQPIE